MLVVLLPLVADRRSASSPCSRSTRASTRREGIELRRSAPAGGAPAPTTSTRRCATTRRIGRSLATLVEGLDGSADRARVNAIVKRFMERNPGLDRHLRRLRANSFDGADAQHRGAPGSDEKGRFGPYWNTITGKLVLDPLVDQEISDYWNQPKEHGQGLGHRALPVRRDAAHELHDPDRARRKFIGIGGVDVSLAATPRAGLQAAHPRLGLRLPRLQHLHLRVRAGQEADRSRARSPSS